MRHAPPLTRLPHHVQEAIEREEIKGEFIRSVLRNVAALLAMGFVLWLVYSRLKQLRNAQLGRSAAKLGTGYRAPDKAEVMKSASTQKGDSFVTTPQKPNGMRSASWCHPRALCCGCCCTGIASPCHQPA